MKGPYNALESVVFTRLSQVRCWSATDNCHQRTPDNCENCEKLGFLWHFVQFLPSVVSCRRIFSCLRAEAGAWGRQSDQIMVIVDCGAAGVLHLCRLTEEECAVVNNCLTLTTVLTTPTHNYSDSSVTLLQQQNTILQTKYQTFIFISVFCQSWEKWPCSSSCIFYDVCFNLHLEVIFKFPFKFDQEMHN